MMAATDYGMRRKVLRARVGSLLLDTVLIAYAMWALHFLQGHGENATGFLTRYPAMLGLAPALAWVWRALRASLGERAYDARLLDEDGAPASPSQRAAVACLGALQLGAVAAPAVLLEGSARGFALSTALAVVLGGVSLRTGRARSLPERLAGTYTTVAPVPPSNTVRPWYQRFEPYVVLTLLALTIWVGVLVTQFEPGKLVERADAAKGLWARLASPDWSITGKVLTHLIETIFLAFMASLLALPFAFVLGFLGARNVMRGHWASRVTYSVARVVMNVMRSIEPVLWAITFSLWVGVGPFAGMLALLVHSVASLGKLYSEAVESIDPGPVEALQATGARTLHIIRFGMVPQVVPPFLSFTIYRWDINVRMATILGLVGGGGIGKLLLDYNGLSAFEKVGTIVVFVTLVVWIMDMISSKAREKLV